jgi:GH15 family glucan-1,4-alpha-glucosidase
MVWRLGVLATDDPRVISTMQQLERGLSVRTSVGGLARYQRDYYHNAVPPTDDIPGNPWIITTLWLTQWKIARAQTLAELEQARSGLDWALRAASPSGLLPEQLHPITGEHLSVSPLAWSHAAFVDTVLDYIERERALKKA